MAGLYLLAFHVKFRPCLGSRQTVFRLWQCTSAFTCKFCTHLPFWFVAKHWSGRNRIKPRFHFCQVLIIKCSNWPNAPEQSTITKSSPSNVQPFRLGTWQQLGLNGLHVSNSFRGVTFRANAEIIEWSKCHQPSLKMDPFNHHKHCPSHAFDQFLQVFAGPKPGGAPTTSTSPRALL